MNLPPPCHLLEVLTDDNLVLGGLLYPAEPPATSTTYQAKTAVLYLHGMSSTGVLHHAAYHNLVAPTLTQAGLAYFPFNNRGAGLETSLNTRTLEGIEGYSWQGTSNELIRDAVLDINAAIVTLRKLGYQRFIAVGHSTGANKLVAYCHYQPQHQLSGVVLASGGDDTGSYAAQYGLDRYREVLDACRNCVTQNGGSARVPDDFYPMPMSYRSLYDMLNPDGDYNTFPFHEALHGVHLSATQPLFAQYQEVNVPALVIYGGQDEHCYGNVENCLQAIQSHTKPEQQVTLGMVPEANHSYDKHEVDLWQRIVSWAASVL